ncbi:MAG: hypothetical protein OXN89_06375 [Bryobacterales bacterium]|nr:hypothetical protein [Bryobacterales bacterium]
MARLGTPEGIAVYASGNVSLTSPRRVRRVNASPGTIEAVLAADGYRPSTVALDKEGIGYVGGGHRIRMIDTTGEVPVITGTGEHGFSGDGEPAGGAELSVSGITVDSLGNVWFSDPLGRRIRVLEAWPGRN